MKRMVSLAAGARALLILALLLLVPSCCLAKSSSLQSRLEGTWVRVDQSGFSLTIQPNGRTFGQIGIGDKNGVDYHDYQISGNRLRIPELKIVYQVTLRGPNLIVRTPGVKQPKVYVRRKQATKPMTIE